MYIYKKPFTDEAMEGKVPSVIRKLRMNAGMVDTFLICLAGGADNFDIINTMQLKQKGYPKDELLIMGFAKGKDSAMQLASDMYVHFYQQYQDLRFKQNILQQRDELFRRK